MRLFLALLLAATFHPAFAAAQEGPLKVEMGTDAPPGALPAAIKEVLVTRVIRVVDGQGKPLAKIWLRKSIPASSKPEGPKGPILYPFLAEGELLGALEFAAEGHDYRDQGIAPGVYTLRYGLQPVNGDHLGVSTHRDYALLVPAAKEMSVAAIPKKALEKQSAESAGSNHPAVLLLVAAPAAAKPEPAMVRDETKNLWGVVLPVVLSIKGDSAPAAANVQLIVVGAAMT